MTDNGKRPINDHCLAYLSQRSEEIRQKIAEAQQEHDAGDEDTNAWKMGNTQGS